MEEWISLKEFMRRRNIGYPVAMQMLANGEVEYQKIGKHYKIKVGGDTVSRELYEKMCERAIKAETKLNLVLSLLQT